MEDERVRPHDPKRHLRDHPRDERGDEGPSEDHPAFRLSDATKVALDRVLLSCRPYGADPVPGRFHGPAKRLKLDGRRKVDRGLFGREVHGGRLDSGNGGEGPLDRLSTARARHPLDRKREARRRSVLQRDRFVPGRLDRGDEPLRRDAAGVSHPRPLGEEVDRGRAHALDLEKGPFDRLRARGAVHPLDPQVDLAVLSHAPSSETCAQVLKGLEKLIPFRLARGPPRSLPRRGSWIRCGAPHA